MSTTQNVESARVVLERGADEIGMSEKDTRGYTEALLLGEWLLEQGFAMSTFEEEDRFDRKAFEYGMFYTREGEVECAEIILYPLIGLVPYYININAISAVDGWETAQSAEIASGGEIDQDMCRKVDRRMVRDLSTIVVYISLNELKELISRSYKL